MPYSPATIKGAFAFQDAIDRALAGYMGESPRKHLFSDRFSPVFAKIALGPKLMPEGNYLLLDT